MSVDIKNIKAIQTMPTIGSNDAAWIKWSQEVWNKYGSELGSQIIMGAWVKRGSREANTNALRQQFKKYGLEVDSSVWDKIVDVGAGFERGVGKFFKVGKTVLIGGAVVLGVVVIGTVISAVKTGGSPIKALKGN